MDVYILMIGLFQSTHPHGVRRIPRPHRPYKTRFQSTHPHGVRRDSFGGAFNDIAVSIHAPTRGATRGRISGIHVHYTFQSTHPHGVRPHFFSRFADRMGFNPRTHTGCDISLLAGLLFSILFQSTHPHGVRLQTTQSSYWTRQFQSTHPHGVRRFILSGRDPRFSVSIHAPTRGAT